MYFIPYRKNKALFTYHRGTWAITFVATLFTIAESGANPGVRQHRNGEKHAHMHTVEASGEEKNGAVLLTGAAGTIEPVSERQTVGFPLI